MKTEDAYRTCERITRAQARNFSYGIRLLPADRRRALSAVYAFARRIDDIGDGELPIDQRLTLLDTARKDIREADDRPDDPVLVALSDAGRRFPLHLEAFEELIDGCAADVRGTDYAAFDDLHHYCRCVAGAVGRLSLDVFGLAPGTDRDAAASIADALGVALQLTNILRDIREDRGNGRVYLPAEDLHRFGCTLDMSAGGAFTDTPGDLIRLVRFEAERAQSWYDEGLALLDLLDRRSAACTAAMAGIYHRLLGRIAAAPIAALNTRMSLPTREKATVALRALAQGRV